MIANYHTHTPLCRHAEGTAEEYVHAALNAGLKILGFSDHTPYWFPEGYYTHMRMYPDQLGQYCQAVRRVQKEYADRIQIHLGLEVEYYPQFFPELLSHLRDYGIEYFILGQHWSGNEIGEPYNGHPTTDAAQLERYCRQVMEAINTGLFTYIAHPDIFNFVGDQEIYRRHIRSLCQEAKSCSVPLEINLLGLHTNRHYPAEKFWQIAAEENCSCIIGCDAHDPGGIPNQPAQDKAMELVKKYDLKLLDTVPLRPVCP